MVAVVVVVAAVVVVVVVVVLSSSAAARAMVHIRVFVPVVHSIERIRYWALGIGHWIGNRALGIGHVFEASCVPAL